MLRQPGCGRGFGGTYLDTGVVRGVAFTATPASGSHSRVARAGGVERCKYIYSGVRAGCWGRSELPEELS